MVADMKGSLTKNEPNDPLNSTNEQPVDCCLFLCVWAAVRRVPTVEAVLLSIEKEHS